MVQAKIADFEAHHEYMCIVSKPDQKVAESIASLFDREGKSESITTPVQYSFKVHRSQI